MEGALSAEERKLATVLFADLVGSTALASDQDPERVRARLERFYEAMASEIQSAGGTVEKFAGDAVMAVFGAPAALEDHAERALHAALAMQRRLREVLGEELALRIGVNTGEMVVGRPREGSSFASGDVVNVAARLEQAAASGETLVGERTVAAVRGAFEFGAPQTVEAKGKPEGVNCRALLRALSLMRPRGVAGLKAAFVGRERELALLEESYGRVAAKRVPRLLTILGDAGVGKTRLVRELWQWLAAQEPQPLQRTGRCLSYGQVTYWALGEVLKEQLGILEDYSPANVRERLGSREILGLALGLDVAGDLHPLIARDRFQDAWAELLTELTADRPVVVVLEDLHWAEEPLLDLVEYLLQRVRGPLLVLATARPEFLDRRPGFGRAAGESVLLEPLEVGLAEELTAKLLGGAVPAQLREIVAHAEGNPFFLEEVLGSLIDQELLERHNGSWTMRELPSGFVLPDTVQAVVAARIDLLEPAEKAALQAASVIGRIFWSGPVYQLCPELAPDLRILEERDFIRLRLGSSIEGEREYAIKHAVTREVAYAGVPKARRAHLHAAFAAWVEEFGFRPDEHAPLLAHHYAEAAHPEDADLAWADEEERLRALQEKAIEWLGRAAGLAVGRYEIDEALSFLHRALELEPDDEKRSDLWRRIGRANALKFDGEAFWTAMEESLKLCTDRQLCAETYAELAYQTAGRSGMWKRSPDTKLVEGWIDQALKLAAPDSAARVKALLASVFWGREIFADRAREASALAERLQDTELRINAWIGRALAAERADRLDEALTWLQRPFELVDEINDPELQAEIWWHPIPVNLTRGQFREARQLARRYDELNLRLTAHHRVHGVSGLVEVEELAGAWDAIRELEPRVRAEISGNLDTPCARNPRSLLVCALARAALGDDEGARELEEEADSLGMEGYPVLLNAPRLRLALARRDLDRADALLPETQARHWYWFGLSFTTARLDALAALRDRKALEAEAPQLLRPGTYQEPFALRALGIVRQDPALIDQALERFDALKLHWHAAQTDVLLRGI
jgi:class 3 adenylate cyclase/tetratricopeptide (TPR) repeat protein